MTDAVKALRALYDACHWVPSEQYVLTMDEQIALWDQAKEALAANEESADWYGLGVKDGRDGCLVELDALQARCDELRAVALDVCISSRGKVGHALGLKIEALRSALDGGE